VAEIVVAPVGNGEPGVQLKAPLALAVAVQMGLPAL
jgi:hypothetical protein